MERSEERMLQKEKRKEADASEDKSGKNLRMNKKVSGIASASSLNVKPVKDVSSNDSVDVSDLSKEIISETNSKEQAMEALAKIKIRGIDDAQVNDVEKRELGMEIGQKKTIRQSTDQMIPEKKPIETASVSQTEKISGFEKGSVKTKNGVIWSASAAENSVEIPEGSLCNVCEVKGNTLIVSL